MARPSSYTRELQEPAVLIAAERAGSRFVTGLGARKLWLRRARDDDYAIPRELCDRLAERLCRRPAPLRASPRPPGTQSLEIVDFSVRLSRLRHDLRRTPLTWMVDAGVRVHVLRKIAGHRTGRC
jgi:hypothetical protein